jgi:hypothetical protein
VKRSVCCAYTTPAPQREKGAMLYIGAAVVGDCSNGADGHFAYREKVTLRTGRCTSGSCFSELIVALTSRTTATRAWQFRVHLRHVDLQLELQLEVRWPCSRVHPGAAPVSMPRLGKMPTQRTAVRMSISKSLTCSFRATYIPFRAMYMPGPHQLLKFSRRPYSVASHVK